MEYNIILTLKLITKKKLNIGTSTLSISAKASVPFVKIKVDGKDKLVIPGSTIKGALREALTRTANLLGFEIRNPTVNPKLIEGEDIVTSLFGRPHGRTSKVFVDTVFLDEETYPITHVRINDKTKTAEEGGLFSVEYLPIETEITAKVRGFKLTKDEVRALLLAVLELKYVRFGKSGIIDVKILKDKSVMPIELHEDQIIKAIWEGIGV